MATAVLLLSCPDRPGLSHAVTEFVLSVDGNILHAEQHIDRATGVFFQRVEFEASVSGVAELKERFAPTAQRYGMTVWSRLSSDRPRVAILASKQPHCLVDLLARWQAGELPADIAAVFSNHPDHAELAAFYRVPYHHLPVTPDTREEQETELLRILAELDVSLVILARYMQVLSPRVLDTYPSHIINIHHSFLPAFMGAKPYHQAQERGVKLIGATAHYATVELDEGPIITQDVAPVTHRDTVADLVRKGRDLETVVLAEAVRAHVEHRTLVYGNKTVVFA
ncbi:formyltetrahydrofolate deformylase [uncultured Jatrophihabitans sp.]|uniref:formyltetrahydrofolate deformylase n=1 Tax=uncultured Jatrophihabitans sp. TaxID=1610747 RepID=UPI0035CA9F4B